MTVIIANKVTYGTGSNKKSYAVAVADSRVTFGGAQRESDFGDKIRGFPLSNGYAILMATGNAYPLLQAFDTLQRADTQNAKLDDVLKQLSREAADESLRYGAQVEAYRQAEEQREFNDLARQYASRMEALTTTKAPPSVLERVALQFAEESNDYSTGERQKREKSREEWRQNNYTEFVVLSFDKDIGETRIYTFNNLFGIVQEAAGDGITRGSGQDLAIAELNRISPGTPLPKETQMNNFETSDIIYNTISGLMSATQNTGVGGSPQIAILSSEQKNVEFVDGEKARLLANIVGQQMAGFRTKPDTIAIVAQLLDVPLDKFLTEYKNDSLIITPEFRGTTLSITQWNELMNRRLYGNK